MHCCLVRLREIARPSGVNTASQVKAYHSEAGESLKADVFNHPFEGRRSSIRNVLIPNASEPFTQALLSQLCFTKRSGIHLAVASRPQRIKERTKLKLVSVFRSRSSQKYAGDMDTVPENLQMTCPHTESLFTIVPAAHVDAKMLKCRKRGGNEPCRHK